MSMTNTDAPRATTTQVYRVYIRANARGDLGGHHQPGWTDRYGYGGRSTTTCARAVRTAPAPSEPR